MQDEKEIKEKASGIQLHYLFTQSVDIVCRIETLLNSWISKVTVTLTSKTNINVKKCVLILITKSAKKTTH